MVSEVKFEGVSGGWRDWGMGGWGENFILHPLNFRLLISRTVTICLSVRLSC